MNMDAGIMLMLVGALIFQCLVLYLVIVLATRPSFREKQLNQMIDLLVHIARVQGVPEETIQKVFS